MSFPVWMHSAVSETF